MSKKVQQLALKEGVVAGVEVGSDYVDIIPRDSDFKEGNYLGIGLKGYDFGVYLTLDHARDLIALLEEHIDRVEKANAGEIADTSELKDPDRWEKRFADAAARKAEEEADGK